MTTQPKATYCNAANGNFLPVIKTGTKKQVLWGAPLATRKMAVKYAQIHLATKRN